MKIIAPIVAILTIGLNLLMVVKLKLLDSLIPIFIIVLLTIGIGYKFWKNSRNARKANIGLGLFSGGLISIVSLVGIIVYLILNWPR
jgi:hypothetical protein